jgi:hypothetical protein
MLTTTRRRRPARWTAALAVVAAALAVVAAPVDRPVAQADAAARGGDFVPFTQPFKLYDTRAGAKLKAGATATFNALNTGGVPATGVSALLVRVVAAAPTARTYLTVFPAGAGRPAGAAVNVDVGEQLSNTAIVRPGANGQLAVFNFRGDVHVIVEVQGYFTTSTGSAYGGLVPVVQKRALDTTRTGGIIPAGGTRVVDLAAAGVPAGASAAYVTLTVPPNPTQPGYFTATPTGVAVSANGVVNYENGMYSSSGAVLPLTTDTRVTFTNKGSTAAHLVVDLMAYFSKTATTGAGVRPVTGTLYHGTVAAQGVIDVQVGGTFGLPTRGIAGAMLTVEGSSSQRGLLRAWPADATQPGVALTEFNANGGPHRASVVVRPGTDGKVRIQNESNAATVVVVDLEGWFSDPQAMVPTAVNTPISVLQAKLQPGQSAAGVEYSFVDNLGKVVVAHQQNPDNPFDVQYQTISGNEAFSGPPAMSHGAAGTVQVAAQYGDGGDIWSSTQTAFNAPTWTPLQDLGGSMAYGPAAANLADGTTALFAVDADGRLWAFLRSGAVPYWRNLGDQDLVGTPSAAQARDGVQVFARTTTGTVKTLLFRDDLTVTPWADLGGTGSGAVAAVTYPGYRLALFARAADGTIVTKRQDTANVFPADWTQVSPTVVAGAPAVVIDPVDGRTWVGARDDAGAVLLWAETSASAGTFAPFSWPGTDVPSVVDPTFAQINGVGGQYWVIAYRGINGTPRVVSVTQGFAKQARFTEQALPR